MEKYYCELHSFLDGDENCPDCKSGRVELPVKPESGGQWIYAGDKLPEKNRVVITYDNKEERDIDKYGCDFIYADPNGKLHWDWHFDDNDFYWKDFSRFSG
jgi:hypothetical protein